MNSTSKAMLLVSRSGGSSSRFNVGGKAVRQSGRLAAKASRDLSSLDKAKLLLMKKSGICPEEARPGKEAMEKYRGLFKQELPTSFMEAVSALVDSARQGGGLTPGAGAAIPA